MKNATSYCLHFNCNCLHPIDLSLGFAIYFCCYFPFSSSIKLLQICLAHLKQFPQNFWSTVGNIISWVLCSWLTLSPLLLLHLNNLGKFDCKKSWSCITGKTCFTWKTIFRKDFLVRKKKICYNWKIIRQKMRVSEYIWVLVVNSFVEVFNAMSISEMSEMDCGKLCGYGGCIMS